MKAAAAPQHKDAYYTVQCLIALGHADGRFCSSERAFVISAMSQTPMQPQLIEFLSRQFEKPMPIERIIDRFQNTSSLENTLKAAKKMAFADGAMCVKEHKIICAMTKALNARKMAEQKRATWKCALDRVDKALEGFELLIIVTKVCLKALMLLK